MNVCIATIAYRRLGGDIEVERSPPTGKSSFEFVLVPCVPCVRARRSCAGGREEITPPSLGAIQDKCFFPGLSRGACGGSSCRSSCGRPSLAHVPFSARRGAQRSRSAGQPVSRSATPLPSLPLPSRPARGSGGEREDGEDTGRGRGGLGLGAYIGSGWGSPS